MASLAQIPDIFDAARSLGIAISPANPTIGAEIIGGSMGMAMATAVDPTSGAHSPALGQYFGVVLTVIFLALGGHLQWIHLVVDSYQAFPPGQTWLGPDKLSTIAGFAGSMFATAVAIALPVTLVLLVVQVVTGVLSRSAPSLNLFALGLPAGVLAGLAGLIVAFPLLSGQLIDLSQVAIENSAGLLSK